MSSLVLYGSQNLSNSKMGISQISGFRGSNSQIQRINNARFPGSTVVDKKVSDRTLSASGVIRSTADLSLEEVINEYSKAFSKEDRYFRISQNYEVFTGLTDETGWQTQGDTTTITFDTETLQYSDGSIRFDGDVSIAAGYSGVYTTTGTEADLSSYGTRGAFECWVYLPQTAGITGIELKIGNDASNYYSCIATNQYDDTNFEVGWNYISCRVATMSVTGTLDTYGVGSYISVKVNYSSTMTDQTEFRLGGVLWQEEERTRNFRAFVEDFDVDMQHYDINRANFNLSVFVYEGVAESTGSFNVLGLTAQTGATATGTVELDGTYTPYPAVSIDIISATNVSDLTLSNTTTGDTVQVTRTYSAGEKVVIDTDKRIVTVNGTSVDYDDVLPRFILGNNNIQIAMSSTGIESEDETVQNSNLTGEA